MLVSFLFCLSCQKNRGGWHCRSKKIRRIVLTRIKVDKQISMNSETDQKADWSKIKKKCIGERNSTLFFFFLLCVCRKNYWLLWFQALDLSFMTLETQCLLYSLKFIWWANKSLAESKGKDEIKWWFQLKTSPDGHCVPPQLELEPLFRSLVEQELNGEKIFQR